MSILLNINQRLIRWLRERKPIRYTANFSKCIVSFLLLAIMRKQWISGFTWILETAAYNWLMSKKMQLLWNSLVRRVNLIRIKCVVMILKESKKCGSVFLTTAHGSTRGILKNTMRCPPTSSSRTITIVALVLVSNTECKTCGLARGKFLGLTMLVAYTLELYTHMIIQFHSNLYKWIDLAI